MTDTTQTPSVLDGGVAAITAELPGIDDLAALKAAEIAGKNRSGVLKAIDAEMLVRAPAITKEPSGTVPTKIVLTCPFGYIDDNEVTHMWGANQEVTDPAEIADLIAHGAEHKDVSE